MEFFMQICICLSLIAVRWLQNGEYIKHYIEASLCCNDAILIRCSFFAL